MQSILHHYINAVKACMNYDVEMWTALGVSDKDWTAMSTILRYNTSEHFSFVNPHVHSMFAIEWEPSMNFKPFMRSATINNSIFRKILCETTQTAIVTNTRIFSYFSYSCNSMTIGWVRTLHRVYHSLLRTSKLKYCIHTELCRLVCQDHASKWGLPVH